LVFYNLAERHRNAHADKQQRHDPGQLEPPPPTPRFGPPRSLLEFAGRLPPVGDYVPPDRFTTAPVTLSLRIWPPALEAVPGYGFVATQPDLAWQRQYVVLATTGVTAQAASGVSKVGIVEGQGAALIS
jgi:hypothetical protein